jgi:hypothetical protein
MVIFPACNANIYKICELHMQGYIFPFYNNSQTKTVFPQVILADK